MWPRLLPSGLPFATSAKFPIAKVTSRSGRGDRPNHLRRSGDPSRAYRSTVSTAAADTAIPSRCFLRASSRRSPGRRTDGVSSAAPSITSSRAGKSPPPNSFGSSATIIWPVRGGPPSQSPKEEASKDQWDRVSPAARISTIRAKPETFIAAYRQQAALHRCSCVIGRNAIRVDRPAIGERLHLDYRHQ